MMTEQVHDRHYLTEEEIEELSTKEMKEELRKLGVSPNGLKKRTSIVEKLMRAIDMSKKREEQKKIRDARNAEKKSAMKISSSSSDSTTQPKKRRRRRSDDDLDIYGPNKSRKLEELRAANGGASLPMYNTRQTAYNLTNNNKYYLVGDKVFESKQLLGEECLRIANEKKILSKEQNSEDFEILFNLFTSLPKNQSRLEQNGNITQINCETRNTLNIPFLNRFENGEQFWFLNWKAAISLLRPKYNEDFLTEN